MSGVYIPNIQIPKDNKRLALFIDKDGEVVVFANNEFVRITDAIEVPTHGVLKDIDVLNDAIIEAVRLGEITGGEAGFFKAILNNAPRVIDTSKH